MKEKDSIQIKTEFLDKEGQIMLLKLTGYIDQSNSHLLEKTISNVLDSKCYKLIFDLGGLVYMSSAGWGILVGEIKRFRQYGGDLKLVNMNSDLFEVYQMLEFYHIIDEYATTKEAMKSFSSDYDFKIIDNKPELKLESKNTEPKSKSLDQRKTEKETETVEEVDSQAEAQDGQEDSKQEDQEDLKQDVQKDSKEEEVEDSELVEKEVEMGLDDNSSHDVEYQPGDMTVSPNAGYVEFTPVVFERKLDVKILPLPEKVRRVVSQFPQLGAFKIKKILQHPDFGNVRVGYFKLKSLLKDLDLDTKEKRFRFYRST